MKMSDVFKLPVEVDSRESRTNNINLGDEDYWIADFSMLGEHSKIDARRWAVAAAHAINMHDELVEALAMCAPFLDEYNSDDEPFPILDFVRDLLTRAKGGCDE